MDNEPKPACARRLLEPAAVEELMQILAGRGYTIVGPVLRDGAITCEEVEKLADLPAGWSVEQTPGRFRLRKRQDVALFGYSVGPRSPKKFFHPSDILLFKAERTDGVFKIVNGTPASPKYALFGVRPCELAAIALQDRVLLGDRFADSIYRGRRSQAFIVAVNCTEPGGTCFCASMGTGPAAQAGFDILLTEIVEEDRHVLLAEAGSESGDEVLEVTGATQAPAELCDQAARVVEQARSRMGRAVDTNGLRQTLCEAFEHPRWDQVASRCMSCGNCTQVCPTCFCVTMEDTSDITVSKAERWRRWDSCFTQNFTYIHGGSVRQSPKSRYRQWLTHKFAAWVDQFGRSGCVGCGRCITWCPVGIDVTEELAAIRGVAAGT